MQDGIRVEQRQSVAVVTIDRPHRRNALNGAAWSGLTRAVSRIAENGDIRCIVLTGAEGHFCAGDDLRDSELKLGGAVAQRYAAQIRGCYAALVQAPQPLVAAISGACLGGGLSLALHVDFRFADNSAKLGVPASRIGDYYPPELCRRLASIAGVGGARWLLTTGDWVTADRAQSMGLVDEVFEDVAAGAMEFADTVAHRAPMMVRTVKSISESLLTGSFDERRGEFEADMEAISTSADREEGRLAFLEKRRPRFSGR